MSERAPAGDHAGPSPAGDHARPSPAGDHARPSPAGDHARPSPAGDTDYEHRSHRYEQHRRADPRIAAQIHAALGSARTVLNVGAGAGSYEPDDRYVMAVEPSATMRARRPRTAAPALDATAQTLPFDDDAFDAATAVFTVHQWPDLDAGLRQVRRVTAGPVVIMTLDPDATGGFWVFDYLPERRTVERRRFPSLDRIGAALGGTTRVEPVPVPIDCTDGFVEAFYGRPEALLDPAVRAAQSAWQYLDPVDVDRALGRLAADLRTGAWDERYGHLRRSASYDAGLRLVVADR